MHKPSFSADLIPDFGPLFFLKQSIDDIEFEQADFFAIHP